jgi:hypothetical protein
MHLQLYRKQSEDSGEEDQMANERTKKKILNSWGRRSAAGKRQTMGRKSEEKTGP